MEVRGCDLIVAVFPDLLIHYLYVLASIGTINLTIHMVAFDLCGFIPHWSYCVSAFICSYSVYNSVVNQ